MDLATGEILDVEYYRTTKQQQAYRNMIVNEHNIPDTLLHINPGDILK
jgi:hypothetical protein